MSWSLTNPSFSQLKNKRATWALPNLLVLLSWQKLLPLDGVKELHVRRLATLKTSESHNRSSWNHQYTFQWCLSWYYEFLGMNYVSQPLIHLLDMLCFGHCSLCLQCSSETGAHVVRSLLSSPENLSSVPGPYTGWLPCNTNSRGSDASCVHTQIHTSL